MVKIQGITTGVGMERSQYSGVGESTESITCIFTIGYSKLANKIQIKNMKEIPTTMQDITKDKYE